MSGWYDPLAGEMYHASVFTATPLPEVVYHYTDQRGLLGILEKKEVWASNGTYLNDLQEVRYALTLARRLMRRRAAELRAAKPENAEGARRIAQQTAVLKGASKVFQGPPPSDLYVSSFSGNGNLLSQWRGYTPKGNGYSVGFRTDILKQVVRPQGFIVQRCLYRRGEQEQALLAIIDLLLRNMVGQEFPPGVEEQAVAAIVDALVNRIYELAPLLKHPAFREEVEVRIVARGRTDHSRPPTELHVREGSRSLVPFVKVRMDHGVDPARPDLLPFARIYVGPTPDPAAAVYAVERLTDRAGIGTNVEVRWSRMPFRGW